MATNNLSAQTVVLDLLGYIGVTGFAAVDNDQILNQPGLDTVDVNKALAAVNSALQEIQRTGPKEFTEDQRSAFYSAPTTLILAVTHGSKAATASTLPPAASKGCSISIEGEPDINRIMGLSTGNGVSLLRAYFGPTGSVNATVYYDCASLEADVQTVEGPVYGTGKIQLFPANDLAQFERLRSRCWLENWPNGYVGSVENIANKIGTPVLYITQAQRDGTVWLRVTPIPPSDFEASFTVKRRAERITVTVLDQTGATDPAYFFSSLNDDQVESVLLPIARWRFISGHPSVKNTETAQRIEKEYNAVMLKLENGQKFATQTESSTALYI